MFWKCRTLYKGEELSSTFSSGPCATAAAAKSLQSCPTLCDPTDGSPPGSPVPGILQARTLEWVAISFSSAWKWKAKVNSLSRVRLLATPVTAAYQAPPSMGFSRQEYWSGVPLPSSSGPYKDIQLPFLPEAVLYKIVRWVLDLSLQQPVALFCCILFWVCFNSSIDT